MTKKNLSLALFSLTLGLLFCSSDQSGTSDPTKTEEEFADPTGTLTSSNALSVCNGGLHGKEVALFNDPETIFGSLNIDDECITTSGNDTIIEWDCAFNNVTGCTGNGTSVTTDDDEKDFISNDYIDFSVECNAADPDDDVSLACEGEINVARSSSDVYCSNVVCEIDGITKDFDGCRNSDGYILVRLDGDTFVVRQIDPNVACTEVTFTIRDESATKDVICEIQTTDGDCQDVTNIEKIRNCEIQ